MGERACVCEKVCVFSVCVRENDRKHVCGTVRVRKKMCVVCLCVRE